MHDLANPPGYLHAIIVNNIGGYFRGQERPCFSPLVTAYKPHFHASFGIVLITAIKDAVSLGRVLP